MLNALTLYLSLVVSVLSADEPLPTDYPNAFSIAFVSNITLDELQEGSSIYPIEGFMYYDWDQRAQRVDHRAGSYECMHFYNTTEACSLFFLESGLYRVLDGELPDGQPRCCFDMPGIGPSPPNWASVSNPTYNGIVIDEYSGLEAHEWQYDDLPQAQIRRKSQVGEEWSYHVAREATDSGPPEAVGIPLLFTFPGAAAGAQDYHYNYQSIKEGAQDPKLFRLPKLCMSTQCPAST